MTGGDFVLLVLAGFLIPGGWVLCFRFGVRMADIRWRRKQREEELQEREWDRYQEALGQAQPGQWVEVNLTPEQFARFVRRHMVN